MKTPHYGSGALDKTPRENSSTIGLLISNSADRRLLVDFLQQSGYLVRADAPSQASLDDWAEISMIITDEHAARQYGKELWRSNIKSGGFFLPLLDCSPTKLRERTLAPCGL